MLLFSSRYFVKITFTSHKAASHQSLGRKHKNRMRLHSVLCEEKSIKPQTSQPYSKLNTLSYIIWSTNTSITSFTIRKTISTTSISSGWIPMCLNSLLKDSRAIRRSTIFQAAVSLAEKIYSRLISKLLNKLWKRSMPFIPRLGFCLRKSIDLIRKNPKKRYTLLNLMPTAKEEAFILQKIPSFHPKMKLLYNNTYRIPC